MKLLSTLVMSAALLLSAASGGQAQPRFLVGTYSGQDHKGMALLSFDAATDTFKPLKTFEAAENASFALLDAPRGRLYATDERDVDGRVGAFTLSADGETLTPLGYRSSEAGAPCYLAFSPDRTRLAVANYAGDTVAVFKIDPATGALLPGPQRLGGLADPKTGHAHWVQWSPEGDRLYVSDLGHDEVRVYDIKAGTIGAPRVAASLPKGAGPRHMAFHPKKRLAYVVTELGNTVTAFRREADGRLTALQTLSTLPAGFTGKSFAAHLTINVAGDTLYVSNRGHNSIASFRVGADGRLTPLQTVPTGGDWPRFFLLDEADKRLFVAHQRSNDITVFRLARDGRITPTRGRFALPSPAMIVRVGR